MIWLYIYIAQYLSDVVFFHYKTAPSPKLWSNTIRSRWKNFYLHLWIKILNDDPASKARLLMNKVVLEWRTKIACAMTTFANLRHCNILCGVLQKENNTKQVLTFTYLLRENCKGERVRGFSLLTSLCVNFGTKYELCKPKITRCNSSVKCKQAEKSYTK